MPVTIVAADGKTSSFSGTRPPSNQEDLFNFHDKEILASSFESENQFHRSKT